MAKEQSKGMKYRQASLSQASEASEIKNQQDWSPPGIIPSVDILAQSAAIAFRGRKRIEDGPAGAVRVAFSSLDTIS